MPKHQHEEQDYNGHKLRPYKRPGFSKWSCIVRIGRKRDTLHGAATLLDAVWAGETFVDEMIEAQTRQRERRGTQ